MTPYESCFREYQGRGVGEEFSALVGQYLQHGYVWSTPEVFSCARPVESAAEDALLDTADVKFAAPDCWYIAAFWGDARELWRVLRSFGVEPLPKVAWRKLKLGAADKTLHVYPLRVLERFHPPHLGAE